MSYTPINWQTGQTITAEKLNKMDNGWGVETSGGELFSETVTTEKYEQSPDAPAWGFFSYPQLVTADSLTITFNGTPYECEGIEVMFDGESSYYYGGWVEYDGYYIPDFSDYPFAYISEIDTHYNSIATETAGTYTVKVDASTTTLEVSTDFQNAVKSFIDTSTMPMLCVSGVTTYTEMLNAIGGGRILYFKPDEQAPVIEFITSFTSSAVTYMPAHSNMIVGFINGVFTVEICAQ